MLSVLLYGSYGFVGNLIAREVIDRIRDGNADFDLLLAGRAGNELREQVDDLECPGDRFALEGPEPAARGCTRTGTDYVDITGGVPVIESIRGRRGGLRRVETRVGAGSSRRVAP